MKASPGLFLLFFFCNSGFCQDSSQQNLKYTLAIGFGAGSGKYVEGGIAATV
jgi:hypothetical protein